MIPVKIGDKGVVTKVDSNGDWYNYCEKNWANAVILTEEAQNKEYADGTEIPDVDIESYFVWIPKYSYKLFDEQLGKYENASGTLDSEKQNRAIEIKFGLDNTKDNGKIDGEPTCKTPMLENKVQGKSGDSGQCQEGYWMTHPAFLAFEGTTGLWVGKFETSKKNTSDIQIKPNVSSWRSITIGESFKKSKEYKQDLQSHLIKNTEWGAVAYLTQSIYGRCDKEKNTCAKVSVNGSNAFITGRTNTTSYFNDSLEASTTGNYSGIYDMSGGASELMASIMLDTNGTTEVYGSSILKDEDLNDPKYYDVYSYNADHTHWERRILGDATGEVGPFGSSGLNGVSSMWGGWANFVYSDKPWASRGGDYSDGELAGVFFFACGSLTGSKYRGFRVVLAP